MIQIPFLVGAAIGAGITLYMKREDKSKGLLSTVTESAKSGAESISEMATTAKDTVVSTAETIKEKNKEKKELREENDAN